MQVDPLFRDFSIRIEPGERVGLVGHSGSGKTTFVKLLHRLYDVTGGRIVVDGQANAHAFIERQAKGYATLVGERGVKLSGGERQRVALARAFLANAPVLVLDEATSSLDSESEALIQEAMERLIAGRTAIVIAHRLATVRMLDRILVFDNGQVVEEGRHDDLVRKMGGIYRRLFERQALGLLTGEDA